MTSNDTPEVAETGETHAFQAEVSRLLHLMVHAVYSNKDIFLRELISNSADACERLRHAAVTDASLTADDPDFRIRLETDPTAKTLTIADNGIGMSHDEMIENLGTIARSGTRAFLDGLQDAKDGSALIGQFGVGFYSAFMVAGGVEVVSRAASSDEAWRWLSDGQGSFTVDPVEIADAPVRGTQVTLHLSDDALDYAAPSTIERIVREYSAHVPVPIVLVTPKEAAEPKDGEEAEVVEAGATEERQLADGSALWTKSKSDITDEEYAEFYGHVSAQFDQPALTLHYRAEGRHEYSVLLFLPSMKPFDLFDPSRKGRVKLYVRRVFIADDVEILPAWLRFMRGVVDSEDLPLNISREMLQKNPVLESIRKGVVNRVLSELQKLADGEPEKYLEIWETFGPVIKEGLYEDYEKRDKIFALSRFRTTAGGSDDWRTLADYVADLKENQTQIFYATGENLEALKTSPQLEGYRARGIEVLLLADPVDAFWVQTALGFEGKPFRSVTQGSADLDAIPLPEDAEKAEEDDGVALGDIAKLATFIKETLGDAVSDVRASSRLAESPVCLVAPEHGPDRQFEKLMAQREDKGGMGAFAPVLELNPRNALVKSIAGKVDDATSKAELEDSAWLLFDQARVLDGEVPSDPAGFAARLARLMSKSLG